jgi:hypothetical protein
MMKYTMKPTLTIAFFALISACSTPSNNINQKEPTPSKTRVISTTSEKLQRSANIAPVVALLEKRLAWCLLPENERTQIDKILASQSSNDSILQRIILSSCEPQQNAEKSQELIQSVNSQLLSEAEHSLLMLIDAENKTTLQLQKDRDVFKEKLRQTIDGISDIETQINNDATSPSGSQQ